MKGRWTLPAGTVAACALALATMGATATADPQARASGEELIRYTTKGKLKPAKAIRYRFVCAVICNVRVVSTIVLPRRKFKIPAVGGSNFAAGVVLEDKIRPNGPLRKMIKANRGKAKLRTKIVGTDVTTGERDVDKRTFRFK